MVERVFVFLTWGFTFWDQKNGVCTFFYHADRRSLAWRTLDVSVVGYGAGCGFGN